MLDEKPLVHLVNGDPDERNAARELLTRAGYEVACYPGPHELLAGFRSRSPQCLVLEVFLPLMSGFELQRRVLARCPGLPVILMTAGASAQMVLRAFHQGAEDFLEKPWQPEDLLDSVGRAIEKDRARSLVSEELVAARVKLASLSPGERKVFELIVQGHSNKRTSGLLRIAKRTVDFHRANLMRKLGAGSVTDLVRLALTIDLEATLLSHGSG